MACATCDYYVAEGEDGIECHGHPPILVVAPNGQTETHYPIVTAITVACSLYAST